MVFVKQGLGLAIGATLMDLKRATTLASVTVMTFMLAGGFFVQVNKHSSSVSISNKTSNPSGYFH